MKIKSYLYTQIPVVLAFAIMVVVTYAFMSNTEQKHLEKEAKSMLSNMEANLGSSSIEAASKYIVSVGLTEGGYGVLLNEEFKFIAHPNSELLGKSMVDDKSTVAYFKQLKNGWQLGLITPKSEYYRGIKVMAGFIIALGIVLASVLCSILISLIRAKERIDKRTQIILDTIPLGVSFWDKNANCIDCNQKVVSMFGLKNKQEFIDNFDSLSPKYQPDGESSKKEISKSMIDAFSGGNSCFEWMHKTLDGEPVPCEMTLISVEYGDENILVAYMRDLREVKQITEKVKEQSRLLYTTNQAASILLANNNNDTFERSLQNSFELIGNCLKVDRIKIWHNEIINDETNFVLNFGWASDYGKKCAPICIGQHFPYSEKRSWEEKFLRGECISSVVSTLSKEDQDFLRPYGIKSTINIPIFLDSKFWGFFSIDDCQNERIFSEEEITIINSAGLMISNAINNNSSVAKIREAETQQRIILDSMPLGAHIWDKNLNYMYCNEEALRIFGVNSMQEYINRFHEFSPKCQPDGKQSIEKMTDFIDKAFKIGYKRFDWMHQNLNGEQLPCEVTLVRAKNKGKPALVAYIRDLREIKTKEVELKTMAHWYKSILDTIPLPITVTDTETRWTFVNSAVEDFLKVKRKDIMGKFCNNWNAHICKTERCGIECVKRGIKQTYFSHNGSSYKVDVEMLKDLDGKHSGFIEIVQDVTELEQMVKSRTEAEAMNRAKSAFLARMSHEIRTPMNAILGITEIQMHNEKLPSDVKEAIGRIYNSSEYLLHIINDMLDLSKIEAGKMELTPVKYEVASLINDVTYLNLMRSSNPIEFKLKVDENIPKLLIGDELRIKQVLNNLLSNAFKYTKEGSVSLSISTEKSESNSTTICFLVSDTGEGMTKEQLEHLFVEYTRFNLNTKYFIQGTGLGMSIAYNLVQMMNGQISVESDVGRGSAFTVRLPQKVVDSSILGKQTAENLQMLRFQSNFEKKQQIVYKQLDNGKVLVVDDVDANLYVMRGLLLPYGLSIETAVSGFDAISKIKSGKEYDIIFMDHMMPAMDGIEATKKIRELKYAKPIVALTADAVVGQAEKFLKNGFDGFISKPVDTRLLNAILNKFIHDKNLGKIEPSNIIAPEKDIALLSIFVRDAKRASDNMLDVLKSIDGASNEDLNLFAVNAHSLKSPLLSIGREDVFKKALELESAGKKFDKNFIKNNTQELLSDLQTLILEIEAETSKNEAKVDEDPYYLHEQLKSISTACDSYDEKSATISLENLWKMSWTKETKKFLERVSEHLLHSDFEEAAGIIAAFLHKNRKLYK